MFEKLKNLVTKSGIISNKSSVKDGSFTNSYGYMNLFGELQEDEKLISEGYLGNSDVFSIVNAISHESNSVKWELEDDKGDKVEDGVPFDIMQGDDEESMQEKISQAIVNYAVTGDVFLYFPPSAGFEYSTRFNVLRSVDVVIVLSTSNEVLGYEYQNGIERIAIEVEDMLHIKDYNPSSEGSNQRGLARFNPGYRVLVSANNREEASSNLWGNNGAMGLVSDKGGTINDEDEAKRLQDGINKKVKGANKAGSISVTNAEIEFTQFGFSPKELSIDKTADHHIRKIASLFNVSSRQFNDPNGSTYNNSEVDSENFFLKGVLPILNKFANGLTLKFRSLKYPVTVVLNTDNVPALAKKYREIQEARIKKSEAVVKILTGPLSDKQKITILVEYLSISEEEATKLVNDGEKQNQGDQSNQGQTD